MKNQYRKAAKERRDSVQNKQEKDTIIQEVAYDFVKNFKNIAIYFSIQSEVETHYLIRQLLEENHKIFLPRVAGKKIEFIPINSLEELREGPFNLLEPIGSPVDSLEEIECWLIPLVGFDKNRQRLGYGKGYYDSTLKETTAIRIGLAYDCQEVPIFEPEEHDERLDIIITESKMLK